MNGYLFDENLPRRLRFVPTLPVTHSTSLGPSVSDRAIWEHARDCSLAVVTQDADFSEHMMLAMPPTWVVHLRFGNMRRAEFHPLLARLWPRVEALLPLHKLIRVFADRIEAVRD